MGRFLDMLLTFYCWVLLKFRDTCGGINLPDTELQQMFNCYPDVVTVVQMAEMLCISKSMAYILISRKDVRCVRIGNRIRIPKCYIIEYLKHSSYQTVT